MESDSGGRLVGFGDNGGLAQRDQVRFWYISCAMLCGLYMHVYACINILLKEESMWFCSSCWAWFWFCFGCLMMKHGPCWLHRNYHPQYKHELIVGTSTPPPPFLLFDSRRTSFPMWLPPTTQVHPSREHKWSKRSTCFFAQTMLVNTPFARGRSTSNPARDCEAFSASVVVCWWTRITVVSVLFVRWLSVSVRVFLKLCICLLFTPWILWCHSNDGSSS